MKKDCLKYCAWCIKKGIPLTLVCSEVNLVSVPRYTWWVDSGATAHISISKQGCQSYCQPSDDERFIYMGDDSRIEVQTIGVFKLSLMSVWFCFRIERDICYTIF